MGCQANNLTFVLLKAFEWFDLVLAETSKPCGVLCRFCTQHAHRRPLEKNATGSDQQLHIPSTVHASKCCSP